MFQRPIYLFFTTGNNCYPITFPFSIPFLTCNSRNMLQSMELTLQSFRFASPRDCEFPENSIASSSPSSNRQSLTEYKLTHYIIHLLTDQPLLLTTLWNSVDTRCVSSTLYTVAGYTRLLNTCSWTLNNLMFDSFLSHSVF